MLALNFCFNVFVPGLETICRFGLLPLDDNPAVGSGGLSSAASITERGALTDIDFIVTITTARSSTRQLNQRAARLVEAALSWKERRTLAKVGLEKRQS